MNRKIMIKNTPELHSPGVDWSDHNFNTLKFYLKILRLLYSNNDWFCLKASTSRPIAA